MLDRMQAADVYSGMSGIDHVSESGDASGCDAEEELDESMERDAMEEEEDEGNSEPHDADDDEWGLARTPLGRLSDDSVDDTHLTQEEVTDASHDSDSDDQDEDEDDD